MMEWQKAKHGHRHPTMQEYVLSLRDPTLPIWILDGTLKVHNARMKEGEAKK